MPDYIIGIIYSIISILFILNFGELIAKIKKDSSKISKLSLLATSSLVIAFSVLTLHFFYENNWLLFISQVYLLGSILYIRYISGHKHEEKE